MANEYIYSFKNVTLIVGGKQITGFSDGDDNIAISFNSPNFNKSVGSGGDVAFSQVIDDSATITVRLIQASPSNDFFSGLNLSYKAGVFVVSPVIIRDALGRDLHTAPNCLVSSRPNAQYGRNQNNREWILEVARLTSFVGGSGPIS